MEKSRYEQLREEFAVLRSDCERLALAGGQGFSMWLAGGGIKPGMTYGRTDDFGHRAVENIVTPNDYQATVLHQFGLDWRKLIYHHNGREEIITNHRPARVVTDIVA